MRAISNGHHRRGQHRRKDGLSASQNFPYFPLSHSKNLKGRVCKTIDPVGRETRYTYGTNNVPDAVCTTGSSIDLLKVEQKNAASPSGWDITSTSTYNALHEPLTSAGADGQITTYTYNARGQVLTFQTPPRAGITENRTTTYSYNSNGDLESVTGPAAGTTTTFTYDGYGRLRTTTSPDAYTLLYDYDAMDRPTKVTFPDNTYEETQYDKLDVAHRRDRLGRWTHTFHDAQRRVVSTREPEGRVITQKWCTCGSLDSLLDANNNPTTWERDLQGRVTREVRANGSAKETTYEATTSRLKVAKDAKLQEIHYSYGLDDELLQTQYVNEQLPTPDVSLSYMDPATSAPDAHGRLRQMVDGIGTTLYTYQPITGSPSPGAGQVSAIDGPLANDTISYGYDELGRLTSRTLNAVTTIWIYDVLGRLERMTDPIGNFNYTYIASTGRTDTVTYPNGQVTDYDYHPVAQDLRLKEIHHRRPGGATLNKFNYPLYDAVGNILTWAQQTDANPAQTYRFEYDRVDQLAAANLAATTPKRYRWAYDPAGNRTVEQIDNSARISSHDNMNRMVGQAPGGALGFRGTVNEPATVTVGGAPAPISAGNEFRGAASVPSGTSQVSVQATDPAGNVRTNAYEVAQTGAATSYTYDPNGSLTADGIKTYEWDAANRLIAVKQGSNTLASFTYDGNGRRATKVSSGLTLTYIYDGTQFVEERTSAGTSKRHVYGPSIDQPLAHAVGGTISYFVADHLGSVVRSMDAAGNPSLTREHDPWGNPLQGSATSGYAFTGREWDSETGLHYYRARYYDPTSGRFLSEDPITDGHGLVTHVYVANNPVALTDPLGLAAVDPREECLALVLADYQACLKSADDKKARDLKWCVKSCSGMWRLLPMCWGCEQKPNSTWLVETSKCRRTLQYDRMRCRTIPRQPPASGGC